MKGVVLPTGQHFVITVFGVQFSQRHPNNRQQGLVQILEQLLQSSSGHTERLEQSQFSGSIITQVWLSYWASEADYSTWWQRCDVTKFWVSLPEDAGIWREVMSISPGLTQFNTNSVKATGLAQLGPFKSNLDKFGYWGCYRDRMLDPEIVKYTSSSLPELPKVFPSDKDLVKTGRVIMTSFPENICLTVEGQDHGAITSEERNHWFEHFDHLADEWISYLDNNNEDAGLFGSRLCYDPKEAQYKNGESDPLSYNRKVQLFYFLDMKHMLKSGKQHKGHVKLRGDFIKSYCPGGPMGEAGKLHLRVETSIVKSGGLECEYVGCLEDTGFMKFRDHPGFQSSQSTCSDWYSRAKRLIWAEA